MKPRFSSLVMMIGMPTAGIQGGDESAHEQEYSHRQKQLTKCLLFLIKILSKLFNFQCQLRRNQMKVAWLRRFKLSLTKSWSHV